MHEAALFTTLYSVMHGRPKDRATVETPLTETTCVSMYRLVACYVRSKDGRHEVRVKPSAVKCGRAFSHLPSAKLGPLPSSGRHLALRGRAQLAGTISI